MIIELVLQVMWLKELYPSCRYFQRMLAYVELAELLSAVENLPNERYVRSSSTSKAAKKILSLLSSSTVALTSWSAALHPHVRACPVCESPAIRVKTPTQYFTPRGSVDWR